MGSGDNNDASGAGHGRGNDGATCDDEKDGDDGGDMVADHKLRSHSCSKYGREHMMNVPGVSPTARLVSSRICHSQSHHQRLHVT